MKYEAQSVKFTTTIRITNREALIDFAADMDYAEVRHEPFTAIISRAVLNPEIPPPDTGFEITSGTEVLGTDAEDVFLINVAVTINDEEALFKEARRRYSECWQDHDWLPESTAEAVYEILIASNASPSPDIVGFEIVD